MTVDLAAPVATGQHVAAGRRARRRHWRRIVALLTLALLAVAVVSLCIGEQWYSPAQAWNALTGGDAGGATFAVRRLRLPRMLTGTMVGAAFGMGGVVFQTMLRNPLASPDIVGISTGASAAAVVAIMQFGLAGSAVSVVAIVAGMGVATAVYALSYRAGVHGARLVLVGIGVGAIMQSIISWSLTRGNVYNVAEALRWLTGSLNSAFWDGLPSLALALGVLMPAAFWLSSRLSVLQLGDDVSKGLGVHADRTRLALIMVGVGLVSVSTATTGPISFVAFLSGPIAHRLIRGAGPLLLPSALVGALLVLVGDLLGQNAFGVRFPVGVVTGVMGAPYLLWLLSRTNRSGESL